MLDIASKTDTFGVVAPKDNKGGDMENLGRKHLVALSFLLVSLLSLPLSASAEWYADLYAGGAFTNNAKGVQSSTFGPTTLTSEDLDVDNSITGGGRAGYWFERVPWYGLGLDVFYFGPDIPTQASQTAIVSAIPGVSGTTALTNQKFSLSVIGIGFDILRLRLPLLKDKTFPHGRLQPYLTAGPALFISNVKDTGNFQPTNQSQSDTSVGFKVGAGVSYQITKLLGLFGEYRFTHFKSDATFSDSTPPPSTENVETTFNTHHIIGGVSFRF